MVARDGQVAERRGRHMAWLLHDGNGERLAAEAAECWRQHGRGFWSVSFTDEVRLGDADALQTVNYIGMAGLEKLPDEQRRDVARMCQTYDPRTEFVLVVGEPDELSVYRLTCGTYQRT